MATATLNDTEIDPATGLPKKSLSASLAPFAPDWNITPSPTTNSADPNAIVKLSPEALKGAAATPPAKTSTGFDTTQANTDVLGSAQQGALGKGTAPSSLQTTVTNQAQKFAANPLGTFDPAAYKQSQLEKADTDWAKGFEGLQQEYGNVSGSGLLQKNLLTNALQHNVDQRTLDQQLEKENYDKYLEGMQAGITTGQSVNKTNEDIFSQRLGNLSNVRGMAEPERAQTAGFGQDIQKMAIAQGYDLAKLDKVFGSEMAQMIAASNLDTASKTTLMNLQDQIDTGRLLKTQDFEAIQNDIARQHQIALQKGDQAGAQALETLRGQIDAKAQEAQNMYNSAERVATQSWQTGERISEQDFQAATNYFNQAQENARQLSDLEGEKIITEMKGKLDLQMQTQEMGQQEKMAFIGAQIAEAAAGNDYGRQKMLISFQTTQELEKMAAAGDIDTARMNLQAQIDDSLAQKDYVRTDALQTSRMVFEGNEKAKDRALDEYRISLEEKSQRAAELFQAYDAGAISLDSIMNLVKPFAKDMGITVTAPDPMATEKEIIKEFNQTKLQFALTHPEFAVTVEGQITGLNNSPEAQKAFNDFMNKTYYGTTGGEKGTSPETAILYNPLKLGAGGTFSINPPAEGETFKVQGGDIFTRDAGNVNKYNGRDSYSATSSNGEKVQVIAGSGIKYSTAPQLVFDPSIPKSEVDKIIALSTEGGKALPYNLTNNLKSLGYTATSWGGNPYDSDYTIKKA
jgi:hypothetical protein